MDDRGKNQAPFDERAALGELERFRADIERYRHRRARVGEEFDEFVRSFRPASDVFPDEPAEALSTPRSAVTTTEPFPRELPARPSVVVAPPPAPVRPRPEPPPLPLAPLPPRPNASPDMAKPATAPDLATPRTTRRPILVALVLLALAAASAAGWMALKNRSGTPAPSAQPAAEPTAPAATPASPAPASTPPPAAAPAANESVVTTSRRAWVRVIADGARVVERELPAESRIAFTAEQTIVIRTGDAGAVQLSIRGQAPVALGRDGEVVTRSFTVDANRPR